MDLGQFLRDLLARLAAFFSGKSGDLPAPSGPVGRPPAPVFSKILLVIYNPRIPSAQNRKLSEVLGWNDPDSLVNSFIGDVKECSHGYANFVISERIEVDRFPVKIDGFSYSPEEYLTCWRNGSGFHIADAVNYQAIVEEFDIVTRINNGSIDEVWLVAFPYAGLRESRMAGPGAFFCNGEVLASIPSSRRFVIMGLSYQRGIGEMFESLAHRAESILEQVFRNESSDANLWGRFTRYDLTSPGQAEVGTVHFAPNSRQDYDWGNPAPVWSRCRNWANFPNLDGNPVQVNCSEWGSGDIRIHHMWWMRHFPHVTGVTNGISNNWWGYVIDPNQVD